MKIESSNKLRKALQAKTRRTRDFFELGEKVYYKRNNDIKWKGPGKVVGQDGPVVFIRHGGFYIKAHCSRVQLINDKTTDKSEHDHLDDNNHDNNVLNYKQNIQPSCDFDDETDSDDELLPEKSINDNLNDPSPTSQHDLHIPVAISDSNITPSFVKLENEPCSSELTTPDCITELSDQLSSININDNIDTPIYTSNPIVSKGKLNLKKGQLVTFSVDNNNYTAEIINRAGKATGTYKNSFNVQYKQLNEEENKKGYVDFDKVNDLKLIDTEEILQVNNDTFEPAKLTELENWKRNNVYEEVPNSGQKTVSLKWVFSIKTVDDKTIPKARLVAKGFEEINHEEIPKDSPTCSKEVLRTMIATTAQYQWKLNAIDIKAAFLQGENMNREVFVTPPKEANTKNLWLLNKCVYGLGDAPRKWYDRVKSHFLDIGLKMSKADPALFYCHNNNNKLIGIIAIHVDDFLWAGTNDFEQNFISKIRKTFVVGKENQSLFKYLGIDLSENNSEISIDQINFSQNLNPINNFNSEIDRKKELQSKIGKLLWMSTQTRPDVAFDVCQLGTNFKSSGENDIKYANKVIAHLKQDPVCIKYKHLGKEEELKIIIFADASHGNLPDGGSQLGYLIFLAGENGKASLINWQSKRIKRVVRSSLAAETLALSDAIDDGVYLSELLSELIFNGSKHIPIEIYTDSKSLYDSLNSKKNVLEKRLRIDIAILRELLNSKRITKLHCINTKIQLANALTKKGASTKELLYVLENGIIEL